MVDVVAVGEVPDPVLLLCGRPGSTPSTWWTPSLADRSEAEVDAALAEARAFLDELGARDRTTGALRGLLGEVAAVVAAAEVVVLVDAGGDERRSLVVAPDVALLDRHAGGGHELLLAGPSATVGLLAELLWTGVEPTGSVAALAGRRTPRDVAEVLPVAGRSCMRITRTTIGAGVHLVTVLANGDGAVACWALPDGDVHVQVLDEAGAVDLALVLVGADIAEVAA